MKKFIFLLIIFFCPLVFADTTYDMTSLITSPVNFIECGVGSYTGVELNGSTNCWNTNTRYQGTLSRIYFNLPAPTGNAFEGDTAYRLTLYMATNDWRNRFGTVAVRPGSSYVNNFVDSFSFVSMKQVNITFTVPYGGSTTYQTLFVDLPATDTNTLITGATNWNLSKVTLTKLTSGSGGGSTNPGGPSTSFDDTAIINNSNENTQDIINNNNTNTQDIINNNNANTENIIEGQIFSSIQELNAQRKSANSSCKNYYDLSLSYGKKSFSGSGQLIDFDTNTFYTEQYINIDFISSSYGNRISISNPTQSVPGYRFYFYDTNYDFISAFNTATRSFDIPSNAQYFRFNSTVSNTYIYRGNACVTDVDLLKESENENTNKEIESQKVCSTISLDKNSIVLSNSYLIGNGNVLSSTSGNGLSDYISIDNNTNIEIIPPIPSFPQYACFYNFSKEVISCFKQDSIPIIPENAKFIRFTLNSNSNNPLFSISNCKNGNQALQDSLTDSNVDSNTGTGFFDDFTSQDFGLSQIITIPLNTIQSLTSKTCSPLQIPIPFTNSNVTLPCMTELYETKFPTIYNLWKIVSFGIIAYLISIDIFHIVKGFKDPESDKVEVLDL